MQGAISKFLPVLGALDKLGGRRCHLLLNKRRHLLPPFLSKEPGTELCRVKRMGPFIKQKMQLRWNFLPPFLSNEPGTGSSCSKRHWSLALIICFIFKIGYARIKIINLVLLK
jgi:hypothetical protein